MKPKIADDKRITPGFLAQAGKGRPKGVKNKVSADVRAMAAKYGSDALETLAEIATGKKYPAAARVSAAKEILDRAYGKSPQPLAVNPANIAEIFGELMEKLPG